MFMLAFVKADPHKVLQQLQSSLPDSLLENYGLATSQTKHVSAITDIIHNLIDFKSDELFGAGIDRFNREFSKAGGKVYSYHFDRGNPFPGPMNGIAHHALDLEYVFGNFIEGFPEKKDVDLSNALMRFWIGFANGKEPWASYNSGKALFISPDGDVSVSPREEITSRRWNAYPEMDKNWSKVREVGSSIAKL
jgi:carboxylesterase type B